LKVQTNLKHKIGTGIQPQQFIEGMTKNKEQFLAWYNRFTWDGKEEKGFFDYLNANEALYCLILCTDWCPDVIWNVPVLFRVMEHCKIPTEVLIMEHHLETMDLFLTNGGRAQPIAIFMDSKGDMLGKWGARPQYIQTVMDEFRQNNPDRESPDYQEKVANIRSEIAQLYNYGTDYQALIIQELYQLFSTMMIQKVI
jgi:hypothetical protein